MARVSNVVQDSVLVEDVAKLENSFISDVIAMLRENSDDQPQSKNEISPILTMADRASKFCT
jgi:hypothetical protein